MTPATLTEAPSGASTVELMARFERLRVHLEPYEERIDQHHGKYRIPGTGKVIRFNNYRATIPADWMPLLEAHHERVLQRGIVGLAESWGRIPEHSGGPQVVTGALTAGVAKVNKAPAPGWDSKSTRQIVELIQAGAIADLEHARAYEMAHQRRKMVVRAITDAQLDGPAQPQAPEAIAETFAAPLPEGAGGEL